MATGPTQILDLVFKRYFWVVNLAGISLISLLVALGANNCISGELTPFMVVMPPIEEPDDNDNPVADRSDDSALAVGDLLDQAEPEDETE